MTLSALQRQRWYHPEVDGYELVEMVERDLHRGHAGPMEVCNNKTCIRWVDWLKSQGVI